ncbi:MAG: nucleotidyltransferase domain-containing protein [Deltaproteobacteria bacterium]|nr:nucleotidyltransferase domain-containing protein [Deltaproteobacteria bacterium]
MARTPPALGRLVADLAARPHVTRVWLFGSRARGDARERSDIDLAIEAPDADRREWLELCRMVEEADTLLPIDVVRLEEAPESLRQQVRAEGEVLYER